MKRGAKEGELVLSEYEVTSKLKDSKAYQWVKGINHNNGCCVVLQLLTLDLNEEKLATIFSYFDALQSIRRKGLMIPEIVLSDSNYPLVLVYSDLQVEPLDSALKQAPDDAIEWFYEATETLFVLHNKQLLHGRVTPDSFVLLDRRVYLTDFGYAPLLQLGDRVALRECGDFLAPEVLSQHNFTLAADIYAFAKTAAYWQPDLVTTQWYDQATALNPENRFRRMRDLFDALKKALVNQSNSDAHKEEKKTNERSEKKNKGSLIPKYVLDARVEPSEGGIIEGGGSYTVDERVTITAIPLPGWQFESWSGNLSGSENPSTLIVDGNKTVLAHFIKIPQASLKLSVDPPEAGSVSGSGSYTIGTKVSVRAWSLSQNWQFDHWSGAINESTGSALLIMDSDKWATAHFVKVPQRESSNKNKSKSLPSWAGTELAGEPETPAKENQPRRNIPKWADDESTTKAINSSNEPSFVAEPPKRPLSGSAFAPNNSQSNIENTTSQSSPEESVQDTQKKRTPGKAFQ